MASKEEHRVFVDRDGVRTTYDPRAKWIFAAAATAVVIVVALAAILAIRPQHTATAPDTRSSEAPEQDPLARPGTEPKQNESTTPPHARTEVRAVHVDRSAPSDVKREESDASGGATTPQPELLARDVIPALIAAGEKEGIAAFPPPGTDPPKSGIVVPEDYQLPPGYVRHYQVTDDGKRLDAILMFSPDYEFVGPDGRPVALPPDRIVPPDMAPPGLPIRMLEVPKGD